MTSSTLTKNHAEASPPEDEIEVVNVVDLQFDRYQRGLNQSHVNFLAEHWSSRECDPIKVSRREDGTLWVIDGQHRVRAAMKAHVKDLLAHVLEGLTYQEEADLFYRAQVGRLGMRPLDEWNASLEAEHPDTVQITLIVKRLGGRVNKSQNAHTGINAPKTLWKMYDAAGPDYVYETLNVIAKAWPKVPLGGAASEAPMMMGVFYMASLYDNQEWKPARLIKNLSKTTPQEIAARAAAYRGTGKKRDVSYYLAILDTYNKGLADRLKLSPRSADTRSVRAIMKKRKQKPYETVDR